MVASLIPLIIKLLVHDKYTLGAEAEAITEFVTPQDAPSSNSNASTTTNGQTPDNQSKAAAVNGSGANSRLKSKKLPVVYSGTELQLEKANADVGSSPEDSRSLLDPETVDLPTNGTHVPNGVSNNGSIAVVPIIPDPQVCCSLEDSRSSCRMHV